MGGARKAGVTNVREGLALCTIPPLRGGRPGFCKGCHPWRASQAWSSSLITLACATRARPAAAGVPKVQAAALRGWSLLLTTVPAGQLDSDFVEGNLKVLAALLHSDDVEVRAAERSAAVAAHQGGVGWSEVCRITQPACWLWACLGRHSSLAICGGCRPHPQTHAHPRHMCVIAGAERGGRGGGAAV